MPELEGRYQPIVDYYPTTLGDHFSQIVIPIYHYAEEAEFHSRSIGRKGDESWVMGAVGVQQELAYLLLESRNGRPQIEKDDFYEQLLLFTKEDVNRKSVVEGAALAAIGLESLLWRQIRCKEPIEEEDARQKLDYYLWSAKQNNWIGVDFKFGRSGYLTESIMRDNLKYRGDKHLSQNQIKFVNRMRTHGTGLVPVSPWKNISRYVFGVIRNTRYDILQELQSSSGYYKSIVDQLVDKILVKKLGTTMMSG